MTTGFVSKKFNSFDIEKCHKHINSILILVVKWRKSKNMKIKDIHRN